MRYTGLDDRGLKRAERQLYFRALPMLVRGTLKKPFLGDSTGSVYIGRRVRITNPDRIHHSGRLVIEDGVELQGLSVRGIRFGSEVSIGPLAAIRPSSYYGGDVGEGLVIGDRSSVATGCFIGCSGFISIGDDVMLGPGVRLFSENHVHDRTDATIKSQGVRRGTISIGDDCWLGSGVTVTADVSIGRGSVIGAGSIVTKDIPEYSIAIGTPARVVRSRLD